MFGKKFKIQKIKLIADLPRIYTRACEMRKQMRSKVSCYEFAFHKKKKKEKNNITNTNSIYQTSYLRSETDEKSIDIDMFYDAYSSFNQDDNVENSNYLEKESLCSSSSTSTSKSIKTEVENEIEIENVNVLSLDNVELNIQFDNEDFKEEELDMTKEKSIIAYILSNLKVGMDPESIPLPAFILESRSILEMYADFYSSSDLFVQIPDGQTEYERFKSVVKWYLSTFYGRLIAKKPYNPILGEVFQCIFETELNKNETQKAQTVTNGPVPWANHNHLAFLAEQVSHHPPVSAFYLENVNKRIQLNGITRSKTKFLGLYATSESIGKIVLSVLDHNEDYEFTFPTAYIRSLFTIPWLEMGGKVIISCEKTGYSAQINFLTKPFYGGKMNQIEGNIYSPDKKILNTITGDWTETIYIQTGNEHKKQVFIESSGLNKYKKQVRKVNDQEENESRKVWQEVTYFLRNKQCELANKAKYQVEQKQREQAKLRKENNIEYKTKYFNLKEKKIILA